MNGENHKEYVISLQLMSQAEDIYQKLSKMQPTIKAPEDKVPKEELAAFWSATEQKTHNRNYGFPVLLLLLEEYYTSCCTGLEYYTSCGDGEGKFTSSGTTSGECKLFASLHSLKLIQDNILDSYPGLLSFHTRFAGLDKTKEILTTGGKMGQPFQQYFITPP